MVLPMDLSKLEKKLTKGTSSLSFGFNDPKTWISTGNYALNYLISGDFFRGVPLGKVTTLAGESGSGKSFIASGNVVKNAQAMGIFVVMIDSENALDEDWLKALGVDTSPAKLMKINVALVDEVAKTISEFMTMYKETYANVPKDERQKVLFVIDSLGMLVTNTDIKQFDEGELKGNMGILPKALKAIVKNCVNMFGEWEVGLVCTNHTYASQNMFSPDDVITGGSGPIFASSIVVAMKKYKLKEDEDGAKTTTVQGIRAQAKVVKSRFSKPFEEVELHITWEHGLDLYSGLVDFFEQKGLLVTVGKGPGTRMVYKDVSGAEHKYSRKNIPESLLDLMMKEFDAQEDKRRSIELMGAPEQEVKESVNE